MDPNNIAINDSTTATSTRSTSTSGTPEYPVQLSQNASLFSMRWAKSFPTIVASTCTQFSCVWCKKTFNRRCDRNRHHKKHTRPYKCQECGKGFVSRKDRDRHSNIWVHGQHMNYLCTIPACLSSTTEEDGLYAFGRVDRWRTHMSKVHGMSKEEIQSIVKKGIPMEKKTPKQVAAGNAMEKWGLDEDEDEEILEEQDDWNDVVYDDDDES